MPSAPTSTECEGNNWEKGPGKLCFQINSDYRTWEGKFFREFYLHVYYLAFVFQCLFRNLIWYNVQ